MKISPLFFLILSLNLYSASIIPNSSRQLLLVQAKNFTISTASLQAYEKVDSVWHKHGKSIEVNLGRNGLAWGEGLYTFKHKKGEPIKQEGDGKAPAGLFSLESFFGYEQQKFNFPYLRVTEQNLCIDDSDSSSYNTIIQTTEPKHFKSYENMRREDNLYRLGIVVGHNLRQKKQKGSCIFLHIQRDINASTAGCTSMKEEELFKIMRWLKKEKNPLLLQLPQEYRIKF